MWHSRPLQLLGIVAALLIAAGNAGSGAFTLGDGLIVVGMLGIAATLAYDLIRARRR